MPLKFMFSTMNKNYIFLLFSFLVISFNSFSQEEDAGLWTSVDIQKKLSSNSTLSFSEELRFNENISQLGTAFTEIGFSHKIIKRLTGSIAYRFIQVRQLDDSYSTRHRLFIDLAYRVKYKKIIFTLRERLQSQVKDVQSSDADLSPQYTSLRNKLTVKYDTDKKYTPWIACEMYYQLSNPDGNEIDNMRYSLGVDYKFNKKNSITLSYLINQEVNVNNPLTSYIVGVNYSYSF